MRIPFFSTKTNESGLVTSDQQLEEKRKSQIRIFLLWVMAGSMAIAILFVVLYCCYLVFHKPALGEKLFTAVLSSIPSIFTALILLFGFKGFNK